MLESKVLVLKPICLENVKQCDRIGGIVRVEKDGSVCSIHLSLVNAFFTGGDYLCAIVDSQKKTTFLSLGKRPSSLNKILEPPPDISHGFAVGIAVIKDFIPLTVAFSCPRELNFSLTDMNRAFADRCLSNRKQAQAIEKEQEKTVLEEQKIALYNDEAVATENYYQLEEEILCLEKDFDKEKFDVSLEDDEFDLHGQDKTEKSQESDSISKTKTSTFCSTKTSKEQPFYLSVKQEIDDLLEKFPLETALCGYFGDSKFVRVYYSSEKYYVVGVIKENGTPKYICYGVPAKYSPDPPKELKGYCSFIPLSIFNLFGDGFWMMFQSAIDGKCVKRD